MKITFKDSLDAVENICHTVIKTILNIYEGLHSRKIGIRHEKIKMATNLECKFHRRRNLLTAVSSI